MDRESMSSFINELISNLEKGGGNLTLDGFLEFLSNFKSNLGWLEKKAIGDLSKKKNQEWWANALGMDLERRDELIIKNYKAIFNPGALHSSKILGLKNCLNEEFARRNLQDSPLSGVSSPDLSSEPEPEVLSEQVYEPEPEYEPEKRIKIDGEWVTRSEALKLLQDPNWTKKSLGLLRKKKKTKQTKKKRNKNKNKTKKRTKR